MSHLDNPNHTSESKVMSGIILRRIFIAIMVLPSLVFAFKAPDDVKKAKILNNAYRIRMPFIENRGQVGSKDVSFYAKTFGGTLFVGKDGILTYNLPSKDKGGVVIKEIFTDRMIKIRGLEASPTRVNYFKGKDKSEWETSIPSYESLSLGQIYKGIGLELRAYGNNVEKLYTVYPKNNPDAINIKLIGAKGLKVNEKGELEVITECGSAKFTKPLAYQEIDGKRIEIAASYAILQSKIIRSSALNSLPSALSYGFKVDEYNKNYPFISRSTPSLR